jgi:catechol 2,3-dioxygenase-like lactoylglutathione lyase family enzyme
MISNGNATITVSDLDAAIRFYTEQLGLKLTNRIGARWATLQTGPSYWATLGVNAGLVVGLQPGSSQHSRPGTTGGVGFGLETYTDIDAVADAFTNRGVRIASEIIRFEAGNVFAFEDLDGLGSYMHHFPPEMLEEANRSSPSDALVSGGHAIIYVSDMDRAIDFYSKTLGLRLTNRFENHFATVEVGSLVLAIHPQTARTPIPGTKGSVTLGLVVDEPIDIVLARLAQRGVRMTGRSETAQFVEIEDPDGHVITLWEAQAFAVPSDFALVTSSSRRPS